MIIVIRLNVLSGGYAVAGGIIYVNNCSMTNLRAYDASSYGIAPLYKLYIDGLTAINSNFMFLRATATTNIYNSYFANIAASEFGGLYLSSGSFMNCTFVGNSGPGGGGAVTAVGTVTFQNSTFINNRGGNGIFY